MKKIIELGGKKIKNTLLALTLAAAGLVGQSCSHTEDIRRCQNRLEEVSDLAERYELPSIETALIAEEWCTEEKPYSFYLNMMVAGNLSKECYKQEEKARILIEDNPFKELIFTNQKFCGTYDKNVFLEEIGKLRYFIKNYENEGVNK